MTLWRVAVASSALVLACAPTSLAHGIHKSGLPADTPLAEFFRLGVVHMLGGYDHLLFVLGIAILFTRTADVIKAVTLFTVGHSTTLIVATAFGLKLNPLVVDAVIGLSVAYIGLEIAVAQHAGASVARTRVAILVFGLIHGLGLATRFQNLGLPKADLFERVLSFNVGVEIGQLAALTVFLGILWVIRHRGWLERIKSPAGAALQWGGAAICLYFVMLTMSGTPV